MKQIEIPERTLNRVRDYVARESLAGRQLTVQQVIEAALATLSEIKASKTGARP